MPTKKLLPKPTVKITQDYVDTIDYQEASGRTDEAYCGSRGLPSGEKTSFYTLVEAIEKGTSDEIGKAFAPGRRGRGREERPGEYTYEKNRAFFAGLMESGRSVSFEMSVDHYNSVTATVNELLWLKDNGYTFMADPMPDSLRCWAISPVKLPPPDKRVLTPYMSFLDPDNTYQNSLTQADTMIRTTKEDKKVILEKFQLIKEGILNNRQAIKSDTAAQVNNCMTLLRVAKHGDSLLMCERAEMGLKQVLEKEPGNISAMLSLCEAGALQQQNIQALFIGALTKVRALSKKDWEMYEPQIKYVWEEYLSGNIKANLACLVAIGKTYQHVDREKEKEAIFNAVLDSMNTVVIKDLTALHLKIIQEMQSSTTTQPMLHLKTLFAKARVELSLNKPEDVANTFSQIADLLPKIKLTEISPGEQKLFLKIANATLLNVKDNSTQAMSALVAVAQAQQQLKLVKESQEALTNIIDNLNKLPTKKLDLYGDKLDQLILLTTSSPPLQIDVWLLQALRYQRLNQPEKSINAFDKMVAVLRQLSAVALATKTQQLVERGFLSSEIEFNKKSSSLPLPDSLSKAARADNALQQDNPTKPRRKPK
jgi:tetratricopeptide (TPR) repeat protein